MVQAMQNAADIVVFVVEEVSKCLPIPQKNRPRSK